MEEREIREIINEMQIHGMQVPGAGVRIQIPNAKGLFCCVMEYFLNQKNEKFEFQPEYEEIINWLSDNQGKGLLLYGTCGRGKTFISKYVIPPILLKYQRKVVSFYDATEANRKLDEVLSKHIIAIDDIGVEDKSVVYGSKRNAFDEIMDSVEKKGKLIIITTNLTSAELLEKYGERVMSRIIGNCKRVLFNGKDLRKK